MEFESDDPAHDAIQQAIRFNLFTLAQASGRADGHGVAAKGVTGSGYEGHYFWDSEVYVAPFLTYTQPELARNLMHFRSRMLPAARDRARELSQRGALFPGAPSTARRPRPTTPRAPPRCTSTPTSSTRSSSTSTPTGDVGFLVRDGLPILVETARLYADLGFWRNNGERSFHIHGVTGPDEYTTVVNNNLFTNVMARYNLEQAVRWVEWTRRQEPEEFAGIAQRLRLTDREVRSGRRAPPGCTSPSTRASGSTRRTTSSSTARCGTSAGRPDELKPLLLHYHPLVIYRFQVLKQADVVLALFLQGNRFTAEEKRKDFEYYDPITTGDSTLSAVVQSVIAAEVGYHEVGLGYFLTALFVDLANLHGNTVDGLHVASDGRGVVGAGQRLRGMRDHDGRLSFDPRLPDGWDVPHLPRHLARHEAARHAHRHLASPFEVEDRRPAGARRRARHDVRRRRARSRDRRPRRPRTPDPRHARQAPADRRHRADGSRITAGVPSAIPLEGEELPGSHGARPGGCSPTAVGPGLTRAPVGSAVEGGPADAQPGVRASTSRSAGGVRVGAPGHDVVGEHLQPRVAAQPADPARSASRASPSISRAARRTRRPRSPSARATPGGPRPPRRGPRRPCRRSRPCAPPARASPGGHLPQGHRVPQVAHGAVGALAVGLVDDEHVGDLEDAGLGRLDAVAHPGREEHQGGVGGAATSTSDWPTPTVSRSTTSQPAASSTAAPAAPPTTARRGGRARPSSG